MSVQITDNTRQLRAQTVVKLNIFLRLMCDEIIRISTPKTPYKAGNLSRDITKSVLGLSAVIVWGKNYAAIQERGGYGNVVFKNYTKAGTGPHFARNAVEAGKTRTADVAARAGLL